MNHQNSSFQFPMIPMPMMSPHRSQDVLPPARVRAALEFLTDLTFKTMPRVAVNDISIEEIEGQRLSQHEARAQQNACNMLCDYFTGSLAPDFWEREKIRLENANVNGMSGPGTVIRCLACSPGPPRPDCHLCKGGGTILVFPTAEEM